MRNYIIAAVCYICLLQISSYDCEQAAWTPYPYIPRITLKPADTLIIPTLYYPCSIGSIDTGTPTVINIGCSSKKNNKDNAEDSDEIIIVDEVDKQKVESVDTQTDLQVTDDCQNTEFTANNEQQSKQVRIAIPLTVPAKTQVIIRLGNPNSEEAKATASATAICDCKGDGSEVAEAKAVASSDDEVSTKTITATGTKGEAVAASDSESAVNSDVAYTESEAAVVGNTKDGAIIAASETEAAAVTDEGLTATVSESDSIVAAKDQQGEAIAASDSAAAAV